MIDYCDHHGCYDTDWHPEGCPRCEREEDAAIEADRQLDQWRLDKMDKKEGVNHDY